MVNATACTTRARTTASKLWVRGNGVVQVRVSTAETTLVAYGGTCPAEFCAPLEFPVGMSQDWQQAFVLFKDYLHPPRCRRRAESHSEKTG